MARLGKNQIDMLCGLVGGRFMVLPDKVSNSLCARGLLKSHGFDGSLVGVTPAGLRALADLLEAGIVPEMVPNLRPPVNQDAAHDIH